jgi:hypothetical protein
LVVIDGSASCCVCPLEAQLDTSICGRQRQDCSRGILCRDEHQTRQLPGAPTIPEQIAGNKKPYYDALEVADKHWIGEAIDVTDLEGMLGGMLSTQLLNAAKEASGEVGKPDRQNLH